MRPRQFRSADLLGGTSLVVPAGTAVAIPSSTVLDFAGYDTLSLKATVAGLGVTDSLVVAADVIDPETGALLPGELGRAAVITADDDGHHAGTLYLKPTLNGSSGGSAPQVVHPATGIAQSGWGVFPGLSDPCTDLQTNDGDATLIQSSDSGTLNVGIQMGLAPIGNPLTFTTWELHAVARRYRNHGTDPGVATIIVVQIYAGAAWNGSTFSGGTLFEVGQIQNADLAGGSAFPDNAAYRDLVFPLTAPCATALATTPSPGTYHTVFLLSSGATGTAGTFVHLTELFISSPPVPTGGGGITDSVIPFHQNKLILDATDSAADVTVSSLFAELTRTRRR